MLVFISYVGGVHVKGSPRTLERERGRKQNAHAPSAVLAWFPSRSFSFVFSSFPGFLLSWAKDVLLIMFYDWSQFSSTFSPACLINVLLDRRNWYERTNENLNNFCLFFSLCFFLRLFSLVILKERKISTDFHLVMSHPHATILRVKSTNLVLLPTNDSVYRSLTWLNPFIEVSMENSTRKKERKNIEDD